MSYYRLLGLEREPFSTNPDPSFFYQTHSHRAILANLLIEFRLRRGLSVVLGEVGTGKTTLSRKLIQMLKEREGFLFHLILDPTYPSEYQFFEALIRTLGIRLSATPPTLVDYREALERFLLQQAAEEGRIVVLLIDEAHKLNQLSLEFLRILLNYETNEAKLLQLLLLGQMELLPLLTGMPNLMDRVSLKCLLEPLDLTETHNMIGFRLKEAGYCSRLPLFTDEAVEKIHDGSEGYPRRIGMLCHAALRRLVMNRERMVTLELVSALLQHEAKMGWTLPWSGATILQKSNS